MSRMSKKTVAEIMDRLYEAHPDAECELNHQNPFQLVVATVLSAQTTDVSVNKVTPRLFDFFGTPEKLAAAKQEDVEALIRKIGLYKSKAKNIIGLAQGILDDFGGQVPETIKELMTLPGVGKKTANVVVSNAFGVQAIAVDTHVFRVANRIGITSAKDVKVSEEQLMKKIPEDQWTQAHHTFIFQGRYICNARKPLCDQCNVTEYCKYYKKNFGEVLRKDLK